MTIYLDAIWLLNFLFDALILSLTSYILKRKVKKIRLILGSLLGSSIVIFMLIPHTSMLVSNPIVKLFFSMLIIFVTFGFGQLRIFIENLLTFYFATFAIGGALVGVHYFLQVQFVTENGVIITNLTGLGDPIAWLFVVICFPLLWYFTKKRISNVKYQTYKHDQLVDVIIEISDISLNVCGLIDSGNSLHDPISKAPVMIVDATAVSDTLPKDVVDIASHLDDFLQGQKHVPQGWEGRVRLIPYRVVGQQANMLLALKPDKIKIVDKKGNTYETKGLFAINPAHFSNDKTFNAIIHPKMMISGISTAS
ncbi:sigma-E processing peptidase SpoIIGA [Bacillus sp. HMF5848]|uniref:sigma-E processing peptidase SpoIIGA n=1 Tax=Bacillus sp. HMF5848 TaxID=2495421 RepID=UPI000F7AA54C|nr:sigma-E processing peptidase SpoIIGA [Bacillus sp. HMF5848]RSK26948.1 sigma-E processing peptidase SpoIIGA [Bacillus sp. HMF5848]